MYLIISSSCTIVKGAKRALISDFGRKKLFFIPNQYCDILNKINRKDSETFMDLFSDTDKGEVNKFIQFLLEHEFCFFTSQPELFHEKDADWQGYPGMIRSAIIEIGNPVFDIKDIIIQLDSLDCQELQIKFLRHVDEIELNLICELVKETDIRYLELFLPNLDKHTDNMLSMLLDKYAILSHIYVYNSPHSRVFSYKIKAENYFPLLLGKIYYLTNSPDCGVINYFTLFESLESYDLFLEHKDHNGCLNKKISIDVNGNIKNCPSLQASYGHVSTTSLRSVIDDMNFEKYWKIKKDDISKCNVCEFRYLCSDCRAFIEDPKDIFSKPLKCSYDPLTTLWDDNKRDFD